MGHFASHYFSDCLSPNVTTHNLCLFTFPDHVCDTPGCASVLILDGNMKNARQVCTCKNVGMLTFAGLNGSVAIGK